MNIELVIVPEMTGTADGLRAVSDRLRGDVFCLSSDFISQFSLIEIANLHRLSISDVTMVFGVTSKDAPKEDLDQEYVGISDNGRVLLKTPTLEIDEAITLSKSLLHKCPTFHLRNDLNDMGIYLLSHWVIEYVVENKRISSLKNELIPYLVKRQYQPESYLYETFPPMIHRKRPLSSLENLLTSSTSAAAVCTTTNGTTTNGNDGENGNGNGTDLLRCFAVVYDTTAGTSQQATGATPMILSRLNNIPAYLALNK